MGTWKVTCNIIGDKRFYAAYRLRDENAVDHSGNREYGSDYLESKEAASDIAAKLNVKERSGQK